MSESFDHDTEIFRLAVAAGFYHPDLDARRQVREALDSWLARCGGAPDAQILRDVISTEQGTVIEPFKLTADDIACAVFVGQAAFSIAGRQSRFRIVSRDTMGTEGGLVVTDKLNSFYLERYIHGKYRGKQKAGWTFIPTALPAAGEDCPSATAATITSEEDGFRIVVPVPECQDNPATFAREIQICSRINGFKGSLSDLGVRIECRNGEIHVLSGSPESMIRIMAHMIEQATLVLCGKPTNRDIPMTLVRLNVPEAETIHVPALIGSTAAYASWMSGPINVAFSVGRELELAISSWLRPHSRWMQSLMTERI